MLVLFETPAGYSLFKVRWISIHWGLDAQSSDPSSNILLFRSVGMFFVCLLISSFRIPYDRSRMRRSSPRPIPKISLTLFSRTAKQRPSIFPYSVFSRLKIRQMLSLQQLVFWKARYQRRWRVFSRRNWKRQHPLHWLLRIRVLESH